jgi:hypothetical protein
MRDVTARLTQRASSCLSKELLNISKSSNKRGRQEEVPHSTLAPNHPSVVYFLPLKSNHHYTSYHPQGPRILPPDGTNGFLSKQKQNPIRLVELAFRVELQWAEDLKGQQISERIVAAHQILLDE